MADTTQDKKRSELRSGSFWRDLSAEGVATLVLVAVEVFLPLRWGGDGAVAGLRTALGMGMVVTLLIESFGQYGGAHMNPAVTISMLVCRKITLLRGTYTRTHAHIHTHTHAHTHAHTRTYTRTHTHIHT